MVITLLSFRIGLAKRAHSAAGTGKGPAGILAIEQFLPEKERIIDDSLACRILPIMDRAFLVLMRFKAIRDWTIKYSEKKVPGTWAMVLCRKRYIEDKAVEAISGQVETVINLGAGFDTLVTGFQPWLMSRYMGSTSR